MKGLGFSVGREYGNTYVMYELYGDCIPLFSTSHQ